VLRHEPQAARLAALTEHLHDLSETHVAQASREPSTAAATQERLEDLAALGAR
jgi:hypothetical protein